MTLLRDLGRPDPELSYTPSHEFVLSKCKTGIEAEIAFFEGPISKLDKIIDKGRIEKTVDGSIPHGIELKTSQGLFGVDLLNAIYDIKDVLNECVTGQSYQAGTHIHVSMHGISRENIGLFLLYYILLEPCIIKSYAPEREKNIFCLPCYIADGMIDQLAMRFGKYIKKESVSPNIRWERQTDKDYCALNLKALMKYGTAEFRMFPGVTANNINRLKEWVNVCHFIKALCKKAVIKNKTYKKIIDEIDENWLEKQKQTLGKGLLPNFRFHEINKKGAWYFLAYAGLTDRHIIKEDK